MAEVLISLGQTSTRYGVFEENQVLTHTQLNDLATYLDEQQRLTRVALVGVGIVCGLRLSLRDGRVAVTRGLGVTSDGDLLRLPADAVFDRIKAYDEAAPTYAPFFDGEARRPLFEMVVEGVEDPLGEPLGAFETANDRRVSDMVAVLFMESCVKDDDLCSGTDCDNKGREAQNNLKLLLIEQSSAGALEAGLAMLEAAAVPLPPLVATRALLPAGVDTVGALAAPYRGACNAMHQTLVAALGRMFAAASPLLGNLFPSDPTPAWIARLTETNASFASGSAGIQYYYDHLKDLVDTGNALVDAMAGEAGVCLPEVGAFPKHLLLGVAGAGPDAAAHRTVFYPSPALTASADKRRRVQFFASKLHTLINTFQVPAGSALELRVTPSFFEDRPLEERAIPFYYRFDRELPIHRAWNHALQRRGLEQHNYSYLAPSYEAQGAAASPLTSQTGAFPFFRVEGHVGQPVLTAVRALERQITSFNLPFAVRAVMVGTDRTKVVKPPVRYTDLHRFHYLLRQDVAHQLDDMVQFSGTFKTKVHEAVAKGVVTEAPEENDGVPVSQIATQKHVTVSNSAAAARSKLARKYSEYRLEPISWQTDAREAVTAGTEFKLNLGAVSKTEVVTPVDSLLSNNHMLWVNWLDEIIRERDDKEDDKLLLPTFLEQHPGAEHFAGVPRGGTFVLVHDPAGVVVGDLTLPYYWPEEAEREAEEPPLRVPPLKPPLLLEKPIRVVPSIDRFVKDKLTSFKAVELEPAWKKDIAQQGNYVTAVKDSVALIKNAMSETPKTGGGAVGPKVADPFLDLRIQDTYVKTQLVDQLRDKLLDPGLPAERRVEFETQLKNAETDLARSIASTTDYVATAKLEVKAGSEGFIAMSAVTTGLSKISDRGALTKVHRDLTKTSAASSQELQSVIGSVIKTRFGRAN